MIIDTVIHILLALISVVFSYVLLPKLSQWLSSKTENERLKAVIQDVAATVQTTVNELEQTMVSQYKTEGKWNLETQKQVLQAAITSVINDLLVSTKETLEQNGTNIEELVRRYIESYIQSRKGAKA